VDFFAVASMPARESKRGAKILTSAISAGISAACGARPLDGTPPGCVTKYAM
jgi:hypothetical protein